MNYQIKLASFQDIELMVEWAAMEGWNPGLLDANVFQLIDLKGFFIGYLDGKPIASISTVKYTSQFSFLGFYIVKSDYRGQGFGHQIWRHAMDYAGNSNVGLDGVVAQQANYKKSGFKLAHKNVRYMLTADLMLAEHKERHKQVMPATVLPFDEIMQYDRACFPCARDAFLTSWLLMPNAVALVYFNKSVKGYGVIRKCGMGYKIGPLFAEDGEIALILFHELVKAVDSKNQNIYLDIPEINNDALMLVNSLQMKPVFETARMYTHEAPDLAINKIFGITAFETG